MSPTRSTTLGGLLLAALLTPGCESPPVVPTADRRQNQRASRIEGEVVVQTHYRGNAIVLLYDVRSPPPPLGAGRPVSFTVIPREKLFGSAPTTSYGPFAAPFTFSLVAPARYLLRGFIDTDTCLAGSGVPLPCHGSDFIPWYFATNEPNGLDVGGAAVDLSATAPPAPHVVEIPEDGSLEAVTGVTVSFSETNRLGDRPAFYVDPTASSASFDRQAGMRLTIKPLSVRRGFVHESPDSLILSYQDGTVWPRVVVRKLADGAGLNDVQRLADDPDAVVLGATLSPSAIDTAKAVGAAGMPVQSLEILVGTTAYDARNPASPVSLPSLPPGRYGLTIAQPTGQTWRVPNEVPLLIPAPLDEIKEKGQGFVIEVQSP